MRLPYPLWAWISTFPKYPSMCSASWKLSPTLLGFYGSFITCLTQLWTTSNWFNHQELSHPSWEVEVGVGQWRTESYNPPVKGLLLLAIRPHPHLRGWEGGKATLLTFNNKRQRIALLLLSLSKFQGQKLIKPSMYFF